MPPALQAARDLSRLSARNQPAAAEPFRAPQPLLLLPPIFSKQDMPVAFAFRDSAPPKGAASLEKDGSGQCSGQRQPQQQRLQRHQQQQPKRAASSAKDSSGQWFGPQQPQQPRQHLQRHQQQPAKGCGQLGRAEAELVSHSSCCGCGSRVVLRQQGSTG